MVTDEAARARELVSAARRLVVFTGAGVSAESGVPTFRGADGLWKSHRVEELATPEAFARDPRTVLEWYGWRRGLVSECSPNPAHLAIARFALDGRRRVTIVTQNVDGLHRRAAMTAAAELATQPGPAEPLELHGALHRDRCSGCGRRSEAVVGGSAVVRELPRCPACDALLRPDVVWFGEMLDASVLKRAFESAHEADVCLVVGTSALVYPAASIPQITARAGGIVMEINVEATPLSDVADHTVIGAAGAVLPIMLEGS